MNYLNEQMPRLLEELTSLRTEVQNEKDKNSALNQKIEDLKEKHLVDFEKLVQQTDKEFNRLEQKRLDMAALMEAEILKYLKIIQARESHIDKLKDTIRKALKMMKYPRLMKLIHRELSFDRLEYTWSEKLAEVKQQIDLTVKEEAEIKEIGMVLCPETLCEFFQNLRKTEQKFDKDYIESELREIRRRNVLCEGPRLKHQKELQKQQFFPRDPQTCSHYERLNRIQIERKRTSRKNKDSNIYDQNAYPIVGGPIG